MNFAWVKVLSSIKIELAVVGVDQATPLVPVCQTDQPHARSVAKRHSVGMSFLRKKYFNEFQQMRDFLPECFQKELLCRKFPSTNQSVA